MPAIFPRHTISFKIFQPQPFRPNQNLLKLNYRNIWIWIHISITSKPPNKSKKKTFTLKKTPVSKQKGIYTPKTHPTQKGNTHTLDKHPSPNQGNNPFYKGIPSNPNHPGPFTTHFTIRWNLKKTENPAPPRVVNPTPDHQPLGLRESWIKLFFVCVIKILWFLYRLNVMIRNTQL